MTFSWERSEELQLRLPTAFGDVVESNKHQIKDVHPTGTNNPGWVTVLFHWSIFVFLKGPVRQRSR